MSTADSAFRTVGVAFHQDVQVYLLAESVQIDFLEPTDKSTEEAVAILQEAIDDVKSLVIVGGSVGRATATLRGVVLVAKLQPTVVAGVRQVFTAVKGVREVRVSQARFKVSFDRAINNERHLLRALQTQEFEPTARFQRRYSCIGTCSGTMGI